MKRFLFNILIFVSILIIVDIFVGCVSEYLRSHAKGGSTANNYYISENCKDDIIILGSSRSTHHYIPKIFEDSLNMSCYNCGEEGNGIILAYGRYKMITEKHTPKLIIYEVTPGYDWSLDNDNSKYIRYLKPYYHNIHIKKLINDFTSATEKYKMYSKMYQNNSSLLVNIIDNLTYRDNMKGYSPMNGVINNEPDYKETTIKSVDLNKVALIKELIIDTKRKGIELIFVISPFYLESREIDSYVPLYDLCNEYNLSIYDFRIVEGITGNKSCFNDNGHMNHKGATLYTNYFVSYLKSKVL